VPSSNPLIAGAPVFVPNQAPASTAPYDPGGGGGMNPYQGTVNDTNAAGTQEALAMHVAAVVVLALLGVYVLRGTGFKFVVAAGVGG
jgi:hypothetical protein